ncbi:sensor histidine kinase [Rhodohalobacter sp. 8-1]|uniref:sensor histidine kinase n=1 Tax=Rhodohalobacter sp. 8-1 TaxID=3131972 RepID=UPI0030EE41A7
MAEPLRTSIFLAGLFFILPVVLLAQTEAPNNPTFLSSEAPTLRFENLNLEDGMAQHSAQNVIQDSLGYMWIATQGGLHRYNGYEFDVYTSSAFDTTSLSSSSVFGLEESSNSDLWVATSGRGLNRFNRENQTFTNFSHDPNDSTTIASNILTYVYEATNGDLWVSSPSDGVSRLPADSSDYFIRYQHDPNDPNTISSNFAVRITEDADDNIWVGTRRGINRINPATGDIRRYFTPPDMSQQNIPYVVRSQHHSPETPDIVWLASGNGIVKLNAQTGDYTRYLPDPKKFDRSELLELTDLAPDPETPKILWAVGFNTGLVRFDTRTEEYTFYRNDPGDPNSIVSNTATNITTDRSGKFWIGHLSDGVSQFTPSSANFFHIRHDPDNPQSLGPEEVWGLYADQNQTLWAGTGYSTEFYLNRIDLNNGQVIRYAHNPDDPSTLSRLNVHAITEDILGRLWVGTIRGLNLFDRQTGKATRYQREPVADFLAENFITSILQSKENHNNLWVGTYSGLKLFDIENESFSDVPIRTQSIEDPTITHIYYDSMDRLWAASWEGLIRIDPENGEHVIYKSNPADSTSLSSNGITVITQRESEPDVLWLGTLDGGLNRLDIESGVVTHFTEDDGLANNVIYGILKDDQGTLWVSTNQGISNYNPDENMFRNYGLEDGLIQLEHSQFAFAKDLNGILYFGHKDGITAFNPENLRINTIPPQVVISDFRLFNETVLPGADAPFDEQIEKEDEIEISYDQSEVAFEYVGLHYSNPAKNRYKYQLVGFDAQWVDAGSRRMATYTNLDPGEYTFRVQASNADGVWNTEGASLTLTVLPPWYRTWWAYGGFALLLGGFIFGADRFQRRRLAVKEQERAALREAELRAEEENKRRSDTEQLSKIGRTITSTLSVDEIIHTTYQNVNELMDAEVFGVGILNRDKNRLEFPATTEKGKCLKHYSHNLDDDSRLSVWCFNRQEKIVIDDFEKEYGNYITKIVEPIRGENPESIIYLPLVHKGEAIGVLTTQSFSKKAYSVYHITLLQNLANYAAIALDNASAYRRLNKTLEELQAAQTQLVQQEKLASLGQLTAGIAHEIKNPLNFVNNFSEVSVELVEEARHEIRELRREMGGETSNVKGEKETPLSRGDGAPSLDGSARGVSEVAGGGLNDTSLILGILDDIETNLKTIHKHGSRADSIVKSMLQHSRGGSGEMEPADLNSIIKEYVNLSFHGMRAGKNPINVDIDLQLDKSIGEVPLMAEDFSRVVLNLVNNAFDAMREKQGSGHKVQGTGGYEPKLTVRTKSDSGGAIIEIEDNGLGIPDEMKDKILQPFFTTKKGTQGTGLGLSITNDIIKAHRGTLSISSIPSEKTVITITMS